VGGKLYALGGLTLEEGVQKYVATNEVYTAHQ
jgi:hypothetical protein